MCVLLLAGCRSEDGVREHLALLRASKDGWDQPSLVKGHRFGRWLEVDPERAASLALENACLLDQTGSSEEAIQVLNEALEEQDASAALYEARGALYLATGFPRAAAGDFQRATNLDPRGVNAWYALGHAYEVLSLGRQAVEALDRAVHLGCDHAALHLSLARVQRALGKRGLAARHYSLALEREAPAPVEDLVEAAGLASEDRDRAIAVEELRASIDRCRAVQLSDRAWVLRSLLAESPDEPVETISAYVRALELAPGELERLTASLLAAVELSDPETRSGARARLLEAEIDPDHRAALERCLARSD